MSGLLLKDWFITARYCRIHLAVIIGMAVLTQVADTGVIFLMYPLLFAGYMSTRILAADESSGWDRYQQTLPVSRTAAVTEKYVFSLLFIGGTTVLMGAAWALRILVTDGGDWIQLIRVLVQLACFGCLFPIVTLPPVFRFGVETGRIVSLVVLAAGALFIALVDLRTGEISQPDMAAALGWHVLPLVPETCVLLALSWLLAVKLYERREL